MLALAADDPVSVNVAAELASVGLFPIRCGPDLHSIQRAHRPGRLTIFLISLAVQQEPMAGGLIRAIRSHPSDHIRFAPIVVLLFAPFESVVMRLLGCGVDDIVIAPIAGKALLPRLDRVAAGPTTFRVTDRYCGPDRRLPWSNALLFGAGETSDDPSTPGLIAVVDRSDHGCDVLYEERQELHTVRFGGADTTVNRGYAPSGP